MLDGCALFEGTQLVAAAGMPIPVQQALEAVAEQGESFMIASRERGPVGAVGDIPGLPGGRVMAVRRLDDPLAADLSKQVGVEIRLLPVTAWLEAVDPAFRDVHSLALATGDIAVAPIPARSEYAASLPVFASTGEAVLLIEARLPAEQVTGAFSSFVRRLALVAILLAGVALLVSLLLARRIGAPIQALANSASASARAISPPRSRPRARRKSRRLRARWTTCGATCSTSPPRCATAKREAQAVLQGVVEGVYAVDADRRIRYLNPQAAKMLGAPAEELIGQFCGDVLQAAPRRRQASLRLLPARSTPRATTARRRRRSTCRRAASRARS